MLESRWVRINKKIYKSYPKQVWSPTGGWWNSPKHWKRNTGLAFAFVGVCSVFIFNISRSRENWYGTTPVPSMTWNTNPKSAHRDMMKKKFEKQFNKKEEEE